MLKLHIELDGQYNGGWVYAPHDTYYFDDATKMLQFIRMIIGDESNVGKH